MGSRPKDSHKLRQSFDSNDMFMSSGHQIIKSIGRSKNAERMTRVPDWAYNDKLIRQLVETGYPAANKKNHQHRVYAQRMVRIIYLYYRLGWAASRVAAELGLKTARVYDYLYRVNKRANRGHKPVRGRPRKIAQCIQTSISGAAPL